jgi:nucleoside-diphosphate-sugar epimerase
MKVFVTGATGFIGSAVARELQRNGYDVLGLARSDEAATKLTEWGIQPYRGDLLQPESLLNAVGAADAVIHAGAAGMMQMERGDIEKNAVETMLNAMRGTGKKFIYTSDQLIYGSTGDQVADEDTPLNPPPFIAWRAALEPIVLSYVQDGVHALVIRPVAVYGNGQDRLIPMMIGAALEAGSAFYVGDGQARWSVVHVDDLAVAYRLVLEKAPAGTLLLASGHEPLTMRDQAKATSIAAGLGGKTHSISLNEAAQVLGPFASNFTNNLHVSAQRAYDLLDWHPSRPSLIEEAESGLYQPLIAQRVGAAS